ncbi:hypothetical protein [endosymbiont 'TC1' of Trimyema compressum]|uniref:hypothetical protein n=1 Tax=endosymbiont 'TC1' of Trimyema compressum TaxID=243899 RepID=UPI0013923FFC|nr:hypothetical protein [endosymbiont 'TC1' of Trimyema compressum]
MNETKKIIKISLVFIILFIAMGIFGGNQLQASISKGEFGSLSSGKYCIVYSNIRNYDAYGIVFGENGKQVEKLFLTQGMSDKGYLSKFEKNILLSNPEQKNNTLITQQGKIESFDMGRTSLLENSKAGYTSISGDYAILITNNIDKDFYKEESIESEELKVSVKKGTDGETRDYVTKGQWIDSGFIYDNVLYLIVGKNLKDNQYVIEGFDLNTGEKINEAIMPIEGKNEPSPKRLAIKDNILSLAYNNKDIETVLFYNLTTMSEIKKENIVADEIFNRVAVDDLNFHISTIMKNNKHSITGKDYQYDQNLVITKTIDIVPNTVEKKEYQLKDVLIEKGKMYAFHQAYEQKTKNEEARENFLNEIFIIIGSILGAYEGPENTSVVCVYDISTGAQLEKTTLEINDSRLQNGVMIPFLLENNKESDKW